MREEGEARFTPELMEECGEWIWEQLQEDGYFLAGELIDLVLATERELGVQAEDHARIAAGVLERFRLRGIGGSPAPIDERLIRAVLEWEDEFLGLAGIPRAES
jgi:GNAT superfamily N-acetyltransferase